MTLKEVVKGEVKEQVQEVRRELNSTGQLSFSTRALAEVSTQLLQRVKCPRGSCPTGRHLLSHGLRCSQAHLRPRGAARRLRSAHASRTWWPLSQLHHRLCPRRLLLLSHGRAA